MTQNPFFWPLVTPRHAPGAKFLHHCILLFITFDLICNTTMFVQNGILDPLGLLPAGPALRGYIKLPNVFLQSSSKGYRLWKFWDSSLNGLGAMVWYYRGQTSWQMYTSVSPYIQSTLVLKLNTQGYFVLNFRLCVYRLNLIEIHWSVHNFKTHKYTFLPAEGRTDGWGVSQYPCFIFKKRGDKNGPRSCFASCSVLRKLSCSLIWAFTVFWRDHWIVQS